MMKVKKEWRNVGKMNITVLLYKVGVMCIDGSWTACCCCSILPMWQVFIFTDTILICPTSLVHHNWYYLLPSSITNPRTLFLVFHNLFFPCIRPSNVILSNKSCLRIWPLEPSLMSISKSFHCPSFLFLCLPFAILHLFCAQSMILSLYASISTFQMLQVADKW